MLTNFMGVGNVGPGVGTFGRTETYTHVPVVGTWALSPLMMAGRPETSTVLLLTTPGVRKRSRCWRRLLPAEAAASGA